MNVQHTVHTQHALCWVAVYIYSHVMYNTRIMYHSPSLLEGLSSAIQMLHYPINNTM